MKSIKRDSIHRVLDFETACQFHYDEYTQDYVNYMVENYPTTAAECLNRHYLFNQKHVDFILKERPLAAVKYLFHMFSEENKKWVEENHPNLLERSLTEIRDWALYGDIKLTQDSSED